jgi:hypothetical protein
VNSTENDTIGYHMILEGAKERGDTKTIKKLEAIGLPLYEKLDKKGTSSVTGMPTMQCFLVSTPTAPTPPSTRSPIESI